jgi:hypothetical protein
MPTVFALVVSASVGLAGCGLTGCASHEPKPAFRGAVAIDDRGISIPLPPPSLIDAPQQEVEIEGQVTGPDRLAGTTVHVVDNRGDADVEVALDDSAQFVTWMVIDLTDNCLEFWVEAPDGQQGQHTLFSASIDEDEQVVVVADCDQ